MGDVDEIFQDRMRHLAAAVQRTLDERFSSNVSAIVIVYEEIGFGSDAAALLVGAFNLDGEDGANALMLNTLEQRGAVPRGTTDAFARRVNLSRRVR